MPSPPAAADNQGVSDLASFLGGIVQQLQAMPQGNDSPPKAQAPDAALQGLMAKIAALLEKDGTLPLALQNMTPDDLTAKIAALLQQNNVLPMPLQNQDLPDLAAKIAALLQAGAAVPESAAIKPSLTRDLAAQLSPQIQHVPKNDILQKMAEVLEKDKDISTTELAQMLNGLPSGGGDSSDIAKILAQLQVQPQPQQDADVVPDLSILRQLKDKIAQLQLTNGGVNNDALVQFKADIIQSLKDQGMDQPTIQHYLRSLAKFLRQDDTAAAQQPDPSGAFVPATAQPVTLPPPKPSAAKAPVHADGAGNRAPLETPRQDVAATPPSAQKEDTTPRPQAAAAATPPALAPASAPPQAPAPPQAQTLSAKIAGCSIDANMINVLTNSDDGFGFSGFGNGQPQDPVNGAGILKPATVETLNTQNFTNYLTSARSTPNTTIQMINIQLQRNIDAKVHTMTLQLDPVELGRMDIKMKFDKDGGIKAHLTVEKPETLALLQKDSYHLERTLQRSGLNIDDSSLSFDLRQHNPHQGLEGFGGGNKNNADEFAAHMNGGVPENTLQAKIALQMHGYITQSGVNIMV